MDKATDIPEIRKSNGPKGTQETAEDFYMTLCNLATMAHAISGGIESPLQFCIQVFTLAIPHPINCLSTFKASYYENYIFFHYM